MNGTDREDAVTRGQRGLWDPQNSESLQTPSGRAPLRQQTPQNELQGASSRARGLGWLSVGLGVTQLLAPRALAKAIGVGTGPTACLTMRALGVRELMAGVGILRSRRPGPWLWARVLGDAMDIALLARAMGSSPVSKLTRKRDRIPGALLAVAGVTALDLLTSRQMSRPGAQMVRAKPPEPTVLHSFITINKSPEEVYAFWRDFQNLSRFMTNVEEVRVLDNLHSRWTVNVAGKKLEWDAEITQDRPHQLIAWRTLKHADVTNTGEVSFMRAPGGRGTEVRVNIEVSLPGGAIGRAAAKLGHKLPEQEMDNDLRRFKQILELGEIVNSDASIHKSPHAARPPQGGPTDGRIQNRSDGRGSASGVATGSATGVGTGVVR